MSRNLATPAMVEKGRRLADRLREARERRGVAQETVAHGAQISVETLRKIERYATPNPGFFTIASLAAVLELKLDELANGEEHREG